MGIGTTNPLQTLHIRGPNGNLVINPNNVPSAVAIEAFNDGNTAKYPILLNPWGGNIGIGTTSPSYQLQLFTDSAAKPNGGSWTNPSDIRIKENITSFTDGLSVIQQINPVKYTLNGKAGTPKGLNGIGVIAQEVKDVAPYTVSEYKAKLNENDTNDTELYAFNPSALTFVLINSVKELDAKNMEQQKQIKQLKSIVCSDHPEADVCRVK